MPTYTVPNDVVEDLVAAYRGVVPADIGNPGREDGADEIYALAEMMAIAECVGQNWARNALVSTAIGPYLELLARGNGLKKQSGETDDQLRARAMTPPLAITPDLILAALQAAIDANGGGQVELVELPAQSMYLDSGMCADRGVRMGDRRTVIAIVPAMTGNADSAAALLESKTAAGVLTQVEVF